MTGRGELKVARSITILADIDMISDKEEGGQRSRKEVIQTHLDGKREF